MQKNFHHATILQFISSLFETQRSSEKSSRKCSMKKSLDPYVLIWQRMHSLYLGEWSSETLLFPEQNYQLQKSNKKESTSKGSNFFVEWHIDFMFVRVRIAKNGCEKFFVFCNMRRLTTSHFHQLENNRYTTTCWSLASRLLQLADKYLKK